jgi:glycosyltransferase involved in cell wall biosynthesis
MRLLYCAIDQRVPGPHGGAVHVTSVANGLAAMGHEVHVLASPGDGPFPSGGAAWHAMTPPLGRRQLRFARSAAVRELASRLRPDVIMERYYNFGGEGIRAARRIGAAAVLEVNAPVVDYPGSAKALVDRALLVEPMRRWREYQCSIADLIVTPSRRILPDRVPEPRVLEIEWGADTTRFTPDARGAAPFTRTGGDTIAIFAGAFRPWHGASHLVDAIATLRSRGRSSIRAVLVGEGPELPRIRDRAAALGEAVVLTGPLPHDAMPACLAAADIGVAPFDVAAHPPLAIDFYWSPLKVFEYMAAGLPVVAPAIPRLARIVRSGVEGLLYETPAGLVDALDGLIDSARRRELGAAARARVAAEFSWAAHCAKLEARIRQVLRSPGPNR